MEVPSFCRGGGAGVGLALRAAPDLCTCLIWGPSVLVVQSVFWSLLKWSQAVENDLCSNPGLALSLAV